MTDQAAKGAAFSQLHEAGCFVIPNPWDIGSAKLLEGLGFQALATTSAGFARSIGFNDYDLTRETVLSHVTSLCEATTLPVSADLENGFGDRPEDCFETIKLGSEAGLVGGSIEDFNSAEDKQYDLEFAKERVAAAVEAAHSLPFKFTLTARAENFFTGTPDLEDAIKRLQAYQDAGADVLYAPGLRTLEDIESVLASVDRPINVLLGPMEGFVPIEDLAALGVRRISLGSALANEAQSSLIKAAREVLSSGTLGFMSKQISSNEITTLLFGDRRPQ